MRSIHFTEEHEAFRREVRRFLETEVAPNADDWETAGRIPREIFVRMGDLGFLGVMGPEAYGGSGGDVFHAVALLEELPRSLMGGFCAAVSVQQFMATPHIARHGSEELKRRYLVPSIAGAKIGALAITEPDAGSDVASIRTTARRDGDAYVVDGAKTFITNGADGDFYTLAVRTGPPESGSAGLSLIVVDADTPGVRVAKRLRKLGWHASDTAELVFDGARVPVDRLVGRENEGFYLIMESFQLERLCSAAIAVGSADVAIEKTLAYMAQRRAFGRPLTKFQALRHRLADLAAELEAARHLTYHTAWLHHDGETAIRESSMAKLVATELGTRIADACLQLHGGYGFMEEYLAARFWRDARGATITAGTSEIMREIIARILIDEIVPEPRERPAREGSAGTEPPAPSWQPPPEPKPAEPLDLDSVEGLMRALPSRLRPSRAEGWSSTFHFRFDGAEHSDWTLRVEDGACRTAPGHDGEADCTVRMKAKTFLGIASGKTHAQTAFMLGKIKVSNLGEMMRFVKSFRLGER